MDWSVEDLLPFCSKCEGSGKIENPQNNKRQGGGIGVRIIYASPIDCDECNGRGLIPTKSGQALLEFFARAKSKYLV